MPTFKSFSASIVVDGKPLDEYNIETSEADGLTTVTCWVPSEYRKRYEVHWKDSTGRRAVDGQLSVDGYYCGNKIQRNDLVLIRVSPTSMGPFLFSGLHMMEMTNSKLVLDLPLNEGEIKVRLGWWLPDTNPKSPGAPLRGMSSGKGTNHQTTFDYSSSSYRARGEPDGKPDGKSFLHFHFRYRPLDVLRTHGIAPLVVPTASGERKRRRNSTREYVKTAVSDDEDPEREIERLQVRIAELKRKLPDHKRIKREPNVKRETDFFAAPLI